MKPAGLALAVLCAGTAIAAGPTYTAESIVSASNYAHAPFAPNSILSIFGTGLARSTAAATPGAALPIELNYVRVQVGGSFAPLLFVSETQINFLVPSDLKAGNTTVRVATQGLSGPEIQVALVDSAPSLFAAPNGFALATSATNQVLTSDAPAYTGDIIVIYLTGLGRTSPNPLPGEVPVYAAQIVTLPALKVTLGSVGLDSTLIKYAGLTPGWPGLYQINLYVPKGVGVDPELKIAGDIVTSGLKLPIRERN
jgi:uncharacterized protein (TIGR03437 family)